MDAGTTICGYIDPNTSQHVFSLFGPILACLATAGGLILTGAVLVRHRIVAYVRRVSWSTRLVTLCVVLAVVAGAVALVFILLQ